MNIIKVENICNNIGPVCKLLLNDNLHDYHSNAIKQNTIYFGHRFLITALLKLTLMNLRIYFSKLNRLFV